MNTRRKRTSKRARTRKEPGRAESRAAASQRSSSLLVSVQTAAEDCIGAVSFIEVTLRSLESQDIAPSEQEVLRHALKAISTVRSWLGELRLSHLNIFPD